MLADLNLALQKNAGGIYVTDDVLANPWDRLPTYWTSLVNSVATINADYDSNGVVDMADYTLWRKSIGQTGAGLKADGNGDRVVDMDDYTFWRQRFGATPNGSGLVIAVSIPEPAGIVSIVSIAIPVVRWRRRHD